MRRATLSGLGFESLETKQRPLAIMAERPNTALPSSDPSLNDTDATLQALGPEPAQLDQLIVRYLGSTRLSAERADALLAELSAPARALSIAPDLDAYDDEVDDGFEVLVDDEDMSELIEFEIEVEVDDELAASDPEHDDPNG